MGGGDSDRSESEPVLPDGCMDIIWNGDRLFVAGPDTVPNRSGAGGQFAVGLRFRPGTGPLFLDVPAVELRDQRVDLRVLWPEADGVADEMAGCASRRRAAAVLERRVAGRLPEVGDPDPLVEAAANLWREAREPVTTAELARRAGVSERHLHRRFLPAVGYGPKLLQRVLRLQTFLTSCRDPGASLAGLATRAGFADQAHLSRETRALAGLTPAELRAARMDVRNVQDAACRDQLQRRGDN